MKKRHLKIAYAIMLTTLISCGTKSSDNPLLQSFDTPFGVPPFERIKEEHFMPAFEAAMAEENANIEKIVSNSEAPTFDNTIAALDTANLLMQRVAGVFFHLTGAYTTDELQKIADEITPKLSEHSDKISLNPKLFERVKAVHNSPDTAKLTVEQKRYLDEVYKGFVRSGALLSEKEKARMMEINKELSLASLAFGNHILDEVNNFALFVTDKADLSGLSDALVQEAADEAKRRGKEGQWAFTISKPVLLPFLTQSNNRELRRKMYEAYYNQGNHNDSLDNKALIGKIVNLRIERANMLGYKTHADYVLDETMAKSPENVMNLLNRLWSPALAKAQEEVKEMQKMIDAEKGGFTLEAWDWWYYSEKVRKAKYDLDEEELRPYFEIDRVRDGAFAVANRLWGITFTEVKDAPVWHKDVKLFEVKGKDGEHIGVLYVDYFPNPGKRGGAWMDALSPQYVSGSRDIRPIIVNVGNFSKPTADKPALLTSDDVETLFHEFGHGLHGLLTKCNYIGTSGTNVARDFVELPSQIMEHWAFHPEVLALYAKHYKTGELIPQKLVDKLQAAAKFNQGFMTTELVAAAILDMNWSMQAKQTQWDVAQFEKNAMDAIGLIPQIAPRYRSTFFKHIFSGGYSAGYYSYLWAEVLDADAFDSFAKTSIFDQETARKFREYVLEKGNSEDPMILYRKFKGADPNPDILLINRGLK